MRLKREKKKEIDGTWINYKKILYHPSFMNNRIPEDISANLKTNNELKNEDNEKLGKNSREH